MNPSNDMTLASFPSQRGRTLIELIIAIAIGLFIAAGVASLYLSSSQVSRVAGQVGAIEDSGQLALFILGEKIRMAGFGEIVGSSPTSPLGQTQFTGAQLRACSNGTFANPWPVAPTQPDFTCVPSGAPTGPDQLLVAYQSNNVKASNQMALADCVGGEFNSANLAHTTTVDRTAGSTSIIGVPIARNVFSIVGGQLNCRGLYHGATAALVPNTQNFKVFFAVDTQRQAGGAGTMDLNPIGRQWLDASQVTALGSGPVILGSEQETPWDYVISVFVCITVVTNETGLTTAGTVTSRVCPNTAAEVASGVLPTAAFTDGFVRRTFTQVYAVRANSGRYAVF